VDAIRISLPRRRQFQSVWVPRVEGVLTSHEQQSLRSHFPGDGLFVAEQLDVPPLYKELYQWSGGPTSSDHCWHEFDGMKVVENSEVPANAHRWGSAKGFLERLSSVSSWDEELSPHFWLEA